MTYEYLRIYLWFIERHCQQLRLYNVTHTVNKISNEALVTYSEIPARNWPGNSEKHIAKPQPGQPFYRPRF
jgi:hypothetical protein